MLAPLIHYLVEALQSCSQSSHRSPGELMLTVVAVAAVLLTAVLLRARTRR